MMAHKVKLIVLLIVSLALLGGCSSAVDDESSPYGEGYFVVTLSVRVGALLDNMHLLDSEKHELVPVDGVIFPATEVRAWYGDSVFDVLHREMRGAGIHLAFRNTPFLNSAYVEAINNLYEFDAGELSGWMYMVSGEFPGVGASQYFLSSGDVIEWVYTLDLGRDVGGYE
ncbi:MAG: DUF4430 domain-containing protein [Oscillospiraceae bacterium]|nr:DUF4430 domain-containing protein [Oscillospiraceae bacterium]